MSLLIQALEEESLITQEQIDTICQKHACGDTTLHDVVLQMEMVNETELLAVESKILDIPFIELFRDMVEPSVTKILKYEVAKKYGICPISFKNNVL
ncbi:hypothetical protein ACFL3D_06930, partial [Candidatus Omnitrophota bacterium]